MIYKALTDTLLKKLPIQGSTLPEDQKVSVSKGKSYQVQKILSNDGLHTQIELDYEAGQWWIFNPHWRFTPANITATFSFNQASSNSLIWGNLIFWHGREKSLEVRATSGSAGYQFKGAHSVRGRGCIPPAGDWKISTNGYWLNTRGIEGMFYHITPDPRFGRSELGLHRDANVPGSAGCIVVPTQAFNQLVVPLMDAIKERQKFINLNVDYEG